MASRRRGKKILFRLRFVDEFIRMQNAQRMVVQLEQGYSPEVEFDGWSQRGSEVTLTHLNWRSTLVQSRRGRIEGNRFPLRTPDFNLSERGLELLGKPSPRGAEAGSIVLGFQMNARPASETVRRGEHWCCWARI
jgi:hypothetical protein